MGDDEIKLDRRKLKWKHQPFDIPEKLLEDWREIGNKGEKIEEQWDKILDKKNDKIKEEYERL